MEKYELNPNKKSPAIESGPLWKSGIQLFTQISSWIVVPIVLALVFGKMLDRRFGTEPVIFLLFAGFGFFVTSLGIIRIAKDYLKKIKEIEEKMRK